MQRLFVVPSVDSSFYKVAIRGDEARGRVPHNGLKARRSILRSSLRSDEFFLQNDAILCNANPIH